MPPPPPPPPLPNRSRSTAAEQPLRAPRPPPRAPALLVLGLLGARVRADVRRGPDGTRPGEALTGEDRQRSTGRIRLARGNPATTASGAAVRGGDRLGLAGPAASATRAAATPPGALGLLVWHLGHGEVHLVAGDPPTRP